MKIDQDWKNYQDHGAKIWASYRVRLNRCPRRVYRLGIKIYFGRLLIIENDLPISLLYIKVNNIREDDLFLGRTRVECDILRRIWRLYTSLLSENDSENDITAAVVRRLIFLYLENVEREVGTDIIFSWWRHPRSVKGCVLLTCLWRNVCCYNLNCLVYY